MWHLSNKTKCYTYISLWFSENDQILHHLMTNLVFVNKSKMSQYTQIIFVDSNFLAIKSLL